MSSPAKSGGWLVGVGPVEADRFWLAMHGVSRQRAVRAEEWYMLANKVESINEEKAIAKKSVLIFFHGRGHNACSYLLSPELEMQ